MSEPTTSGTGAVTSTVHSPVKNRLAIIIVATIGGVLFVVALILIIVPLARRRASRRKKKQAEGSSSSDVTSTTFNSRREVHNRAVSADASVPLLEPDFTTPAPEYSRFGSLTMLTTTQPDAYSQSSSPPTPSTTYSLHSPRLFAPTFSSFSARPPLPDSEPRIPSRSRFTRSAPQQPLRHTRTRIARVPMDPLPEDLAMDTTPPRSPSPIATSTRPYAPARSRSRSPSPSPSPSHVSSRASAASVARAPSPPPAAPSPSNWLHIPKTAGIPLIGAFRKSISSVASKGSSLPTMQHYPSFTQSQNAYSGSASTRSSQTFYSVGSGRPTVGHGVSPSPTPPPPPLPSEHGELSRPPVPRLKPGGGGERVPQVYLNPPDNYHPASRQASMEYSPQVALPGSLRPGEKSRPVSSTVGSGSSLSLYVDARSQIGGAGEDGRWNGSGNGSVGGSSVRGRQKS